MKNSFSPLSLLSVVGAGGISIIPFAFFNYVTPHAKGLVTHSDIASLTFGFWHNLLFMGLEAVMVIFATLHLILLSIYLPKMIKFFKSNSYRDLQTDPIKSPAILTGFIALAMTMNVFIGPVRFFIPSFSQNLQSFMLPALIFWALLGLLFMVNEMKILKGLFANQVDLGRASFGWLLDIFAMSMLAVTGSGIAALSKNPGIAGVAAFFSLMLATMAIFFSSIKVPMIFQKHFVEKSLPEKYFLPSFLNLIPAVTLLTITFFRLGHYLESGLGYHVDHLFIMVVLAGFVFETWYMVFGLNILYGYFRNHHFENDHFPAQWGLICPFVAYGVLASFVYSVFVASPIFMVLALLGMGISIFLFIDILIKHIRCKTGFMDCSEA